MINGKKYTSDVIIFPDGVRSGWWKKMGHKLCIEDLVEVLREGVEVLIIGTGSRGGLRVPPELKWYMEERGIKVIVETTDKAYLTFNQLHPSQRVAAAFHLTC